MASDLTVDHFRYGLEAKLDLGRFREFGESGPQNSVFHFLEPFVSKRAARFHSKNANNFHFLENEQNFL